MNNAPGFTMSIVDSQQSNIDVAMWDKVMDAWDNKQYRDVVFKSLEYLNPEITKKYADDSGNKFSIPHGSVMVNLEITETDVNVDAPFLNVTDAAKVPLFRQIAQINFSPLNLTEIVLKDNELRFWFTTRLDMCEPYKLYDALREICINADRYDDQFIKDFKARWIQEPRISRYSDDLYNQIDSNLRSIIDEALSYVNYFEDKRMYGFAWDMLNITIKRIDYYTSPQGNFRNDIEDVIAFMEKRGNRLDQIGEGKKFLETLKGKSKDDLLEDVYHVDVFVPYKFRGSLDNVKKNLKESYDRAANERNSGDHMAATITMMYAFYNLMYQYHVSDALATGIQDGLGNAGGKQWNVASDSLWSTLDAVMRDLKFPGGHSHPEKKKGFFASLFGGDK